MNAAIADAYHIAISVPMRKKAGNMAFFALLVVKF